ncbi:unnamed protein product, partial [Rotaria sp. Silwood2]
MITAYLSDKYARHAIFIIFWSSVSIVGYTILISVENVIVKYLAVFLAAGGLAPCISTSIAFLSGNTSPQTKRATALAFMISVGNIGGAISGQLYRAQDAPRFILGHAVNLGFCAFGLINVVILFFGLRAENRRRDRLYGPIPSSFAVASVDSTSFGTDIQCSDPCGLGSDEDRRRW